MDDTLVLLEDHSVLLMRLAVSKTQPQKRLLPTERCRHTRLSEFSASKSVQDSTLSCNLLS